MYLSWVIKIGVVIITSNSESFSLVEIVNPNTSRRILFLICDFIVTSLVQSNKETMYFLQISVRPVPTITPRGPPVVPGRLRYEVVRIVHQDQEYWVILTTVRSVVLVKVRRLTLLSFFFPCGREKILLKDLQDAL